MTYRRPTGGARPCTALALLLTAAIAVSGCGGSSTVASASTQWIASADAICRQLNARLVSTAPNAHASHLAIGQNALRHAALERDAVAKLATLAPPASLAHDWAQILGYRRTLAAQLVTLAGYWKANDVKAIRALATSKGKIHIEMAAIASRDGFNDCAFVGSAASATSPG